MGLNIQALGAAVSESQKDNAVMVRAKPCTASVDTTLGESRLEPVLYVTCEKRSQLCYINKESRNQNH